MHEMGFDKFYNIFRVLCVQNGHKTCTLIVLVIFSIFDQVRHRGMKRLLTPSHGLNKKFFQKIFCVHEFTRKSTLENIKEVLQRLKYIE